MAEVSPHPADVLAAYRANAVGWVTENIEKAIAELSLADCVRLVMYSACHKIDPALTFLDKESLDRARVERERAAPAQH